MHGYRRVLVLLDARPQSLDAFEIACRLAADDGAALTALVVVGVPPSLPLDAHMGREEDEARALLERAGATGDSYGVRIRARLVRSRDPGTAVVREATADRAQLIVLGAPRRELGAPSHTPSADDAQRRPDSGPVPRHGRLGPVELELRDPARALALRLDIHDTRLEVAL